jgi:hypothetical protein
MPGNEETARRMVRRSLERADNVGWIERTGRHSGSRLNRSNSYRLTIPKNIRPDKFDGSSGQIEEVDRTRESGRIGKVNREGEHSVSSILPSLARGPTRISPRAPKGEFEREPAALSRQPTFTEEDVERVRDLILQEVGEFPRTMSIAKIVGMCRDGYEYPINGRQIAAIADAGHLGRIDNSVFVPQGAAPDVGARTEGVKM